MINCNENENGNGKIDHINKMYIYIYTKDADIETNIENVAYLGKTMSLCNKQHLSNIEAQFIKKLSNAEAELKKSIAHKKRRAAHAIHKFRILLKNHIKLSQISSM